MNPDVQNGSDKIVICPVVIGFFHGSCDTNIHLVMALTIGVGEVPVLRLKMSPGSLVFVTLEFIMVFIMTRAHSMHFLR